MNFREISTQNIYFKFCYDTQIQLPREALNYHNHHRETLFLMHNIRL
jgi:hypothetical protein